MKQAHSELKKIRTMNFFLDAAETLSQVKGFQNLSTRTVAEEAGYNSATLYHYFEILYSIFANAYKQITISGLKNENSFFRFF